VGVLKDIANLLPRTIRLTFLWWKYAHTFDEPDQWKHAFWRLAAGIGLFVIAYKAFLLPMSQTGAPSISECGGAEDVAIMNEIGSVAMVMFQVIPVSIVIWLLVSWRRPRPRFLSVLAVTMDSYTCVIVSGVLIFAVAYVCSLFLPPIGDGLEVWSIVVLGLSLLLGLLGAVLISHQILTLPALIMRRASTIRTPLYWSLPAIVIAWTVDVIPHFLIEPPITCLTGELILRVTGSPGS